MTALRFIGVDPESQQGNSPTVWVDEDTSDLVIQGWKLDGETTAQVGRVPDHETVVRVPARMVEIIRRACDDAERPNV